MGGMRWVWVVASVVAVLGLGCERPSSKQARSGLVAAQMTFTYAMGYVTAAAGGLTTQLTPAFSWVLGALLLGEPIEALAVVGACVCMGGVLWGTGLAPRLLIPASRPSV